MRFGDELDAVSLREVPWPDDALPAGAFGKITELTAGKRVVLTPIDANEPSSPRRSPAPASAPRCPRCSRRHEGGRPRVNDVEGVAGFVLPGDHVDVVLTRQIDKDNATNDVVMENARVLAIDQMADAQTDKPSVVKAVTLEVDVTDGAEARARLLGRHAVAVAAQGRRNAEGDTRRVTLTISAAGRAERFALRHRRRDARVEERARRIQRARRTRQRARGRAVAASSRRMTDERTTIDNRRQTATWGQRVAAGSPT